MTMIDTSDCRFAKAVALADQAGQWLKCRTHEGKKAYGIRSSRDANHVYFVTQSRCDCFDAQRHVCKHQIAVQIHCARVAGKPMPASDTVDGLAEMVDQRKPVLTMVRHDDGEISWERRDPLICDECGCFRSKHDSTCSQWTEPLPPMTAAQAARIFGRL